MPANPPRRWKYPALFKFMLLQQSTEPSKTSWYIVELTSFIVRSKDATIFFEFHSYESLDDMRPNVWSENIYHKAGIGNKGGLYLLAVILKIKCVEVYIQLSFQVCLDFLDMFPYTINPRHGCEWLERRRYLFNSLFRTWLSIFTDKLLERMRTSRVWATSL